MRQQISNEQEFEDNLNKLGSLYEEGKDCLNQLFSQWKLIKEREAHARLYDILKEMRDLAAVQMQHKHWINEN